MHVYVGTSGWSYSVGEGRWVGVFYPATPRLDHLAFYAQYFDAVEINSSFYRPIVPQMARGWVQRTPAHFRFTAKLYQKFTHPRMYEEATGRPADLSQDDFDQFKRGLEPLAEARRLGALLAQFPPSFKCEPGAVEYLEDLVRQFGEYPLVVELRHRSWTEHPEVPRWLGDLRVSWAMIDEPRFRSSVGDVPLTGPLGYFRFHGRNAQQWWSGDRETRYDYLYAEDEQGALAAEVRQVAERGRETYVFYNNHFRAKAVVNALHMKRLLGQPVATPLPAELVAAYPQLQRLACGD
ncbi:MAG TPA: DUF72 domain-containing protein [Chloroflexota bacterium]